MIGGALITGKPAIEELITGGPPDAGEAAEPTVAQPALSMAENGPVVMTWTSRARVFGHWRWKVEDLDPASVALAGDTRLPLSATVRELAPRVRGASMVTHVTLRNPNRDTIQGALAYPVEGFTCAQARSGVPLPLVTTLPARGTMTIAITCVAKSDPGSRTTATLAFVPSTDSRLDPVESTITTRINRSPAGGSRGASVVVKDALRGSPAIESLSAGGGSTARGVQYTALITSPTTGQPCRTPRRAVHLHDSVTDTRLASSNRVAVEVCRPTRVVTAGPPARTSSPFHIGQPAIVTPSPRDSSTAPTPPSTPHPVATTSPSVPGVAIRPQEPAGSGTGGPLVAPSPNDVTAGPPDSEAPPTAGAASTDTDPEAPPAQGAG